MTGGTATVVAVAAAASTFYFSVPTRGAAECSAVDAGADGQCCGRVGDTRGDMTEFMGLAEKVSKFNQEALKHLERQTLNPFSGRFSRSPSPRPKFSKDEYGKWVFEIEQPIILAFLCLAQVTLQAHFRGDQK